MTEAKSLPLGVPAFKPLKTPSPLTGLDRVDGSRPGPAPNNMQMVRQKLQQPVQMGAAMEADKNQMLLQRMHQSQHMQHQQYSPQNTFSRKAAMYQFPAPNLALANMSFIQSQLAMQGLAQPIAAALTGNYAPKYSPVAISPAAGPFKPQVPAFQAMPSSVSRISTGQIVHLDLNGKSEAVNPNSIYSTNVKREVSALNRVRDVAPELSVMFQGSQNRFTNIIEFFPTRT